MLKEAEAALERAEIDLERTQIVAPFDGRVRTESLDEGQFLQRGPLSRLSTPLKRSKCAFPSPTLNSPISIPRLRKRVQHPPITMS